MLNFGNKEFRNLQEQVLKNAQDIEALRNRPLLEIKVVEELPEEGVGGVLYLVPAADGDEGNLYEEFVWIDDEWEQVGSTEVDLSAYPTLAGDNTLTGKNTFEDKVIASDDLQTHDIYPATSGDYNIGSASKKYEAGYINTIHSSWKVETPRLQSTTDDIAVLSTAENATVYLYPDVDGKLALGKSNKRISTVYASGITNDYSALSIKGKSGVSFTCDNGSDVKPSSDAQITLGNASARWKTLHLSHYVSWGNNVLIGKDSSNRFYITGSDGNTKIKVGSTETLVATTLSPDQETYDLGRTGLRWNNVYVKGNLTDGTAAIAVADIAKNSKSLNNNDDLWYSGNLGKTSGQATIDISDEGVGAPPAGVYFFIYGNAQAMFFLNDALLQNAAYYPIRVACPVLIKDGGGAVSGATGNLKIERSGTTLTLTVASTISGAARTEYASDTQGWGFYIYHTGL